jgi:hypothetical protein
MFWALSRDQNVIKIAEEPPFWPFRDSTAVRQVNLLLENFGRELFGSPNEIRINEPLVNSHVFETL